MSPVPFQFQSSIPLFASTTEYFTNSCTSPATTFTTTTAKHITSLIHLTHPITFIILFTILFPVLLAIPIGVCVTMCLASCRLYGDFTGQEGKLDGEYASLMRGLEKGLGMESEDYDHGGDEVEVAGEIDGKKSDIVNVDLAIEGEDDRTYTLTG